MGFYFRKSIRVGPLRFNMSKGGIGVSAGIKGLRVGFGPRGNYVHAGANGIYYRSTLTPKHVKQESASSPSVVLEAEEVELKEIDSDMHLLFQESSADDLVAEISKKNSLYYSWKWVFAFCIGLGAYAHPYFFWAAILFVPLAYLWDETRKSVVLFYDFDEDAQKKFERVVESYTEALKARKIWHIQSQGAVKDSKYHAGANALVTRKETKAKLKPPKFLKTNIPIPTLHVGTQIICFLPDKLLIVSKKKAASIRYQELSFEVSASRFIETGSVPSDAEVVDHTWRFVNKKGGPDKRFKNNPKYAVCLYEDVRLISQSGLNEYVQLSRRGHFESFKGSVVEWSRKAS